MAFAVAEAVKGAEDTIANPSVAFATTPTDGDLIVMVFQAGLGTVNADLTLPAGYTRRIAVDDGTGCFLIADKVAASTGKPQTITWANASVATWSMAIYRYTGQAATGYFDRESHASAGSGFSGPPGSITPFTVGELFIAAARQNGTNGGTEAIDSSFSADLTATFGRLIVGDKIKSGADGAAESPSISWTTSRAWTAGMVAYSTTTVTPSTGHPAARRMRNVPHVRLGRGGPIAVGG